jgi:hypothetical protein
MREDALNALLAGIAVSPYMPKSVLLFCQAAAPGQGADRPAPMEPL